jgi:hypothetical protein
MLEVRKNGFMKFNFFLYLILYFTSTTLYFVSILIYMELSQGNFLCSYLKNKNVIVFILQNRRIGEQNRSYLGGW